MANQTEIQLLADYSFDGKNEAEIRGDWIEPLLRQLGYGLGTRHDVLRERSLALNPPARMVGSSRIEIDFVPTVFGHRMWIIEAKRPQTGDSLFSDQHLGQAWSYATDPRVAVPLIVLCDGTRIGIFDLAIPEWNVPVFDRPKAELPHHFDELFGWLGAPRVAERIRQLQMIHLRTALMAQVDLSALDRTIQEVTTMANEARPVVLKRREEIREQAREESQTRGQAAVDAAGIWGLTGHLNGPLFTTMADIDRAVELVERQAPQNRVREFDQFERASTPRGQDHPRMWFWLRVVRMGCAIELVDDESCGEHCRAAAMQAAIDHANTFTEDPLSAAAYRLQRMLGPLGWRLSANMMPGIEASAKTLLESLEVEEWLRLDGQFGATAKDQYVRAALLSPRAIQARVEPWDVETLTAFAYSVEKLLDLLPKPADMEHLQPAGDPWQESWLTGDPLRDVTAATLHALGARENRPATVALARELHAEYYS